ncbi:MAG: terminase large subunit [Chloroflexi bacterium HGW-Chloroflexi-8]|nr:MAG: terminase large subunit [Chloroflexi bacterium HGW-Chloroflexi-8]
MFSDARADRAVKFFEMLKHTKGKFHGQPFTLLPWQSNIIRDVYGTLKNDGTRQYKFAYLEIPKKNGKSEMAAGAALYHLFADGEKNGEVYGCAADRGQASIVFDVAVDMIDQLPALHKRTKILSAKKRILDKVSGSYYQVLSAEAYTKHGLNASAVIFDELHAQPNRDLWDVMTFGAGDARSQPIWWVITTAGDDPDRVSIGWEQHDYAMMLLSGERADPTWYPVIFGYEGDDIYNEHNWHIANPSLGTTIQIESVRESAVKAKIKPADERLFRWLRLNQWITTKLTTWLPLDLFEKTVGDWNPMDLVGLDCFLGIDLSSTTDLTSIALVFPPQGTLLEWRVMWHSWIPREGMQERINTDKVHYDKFEKAGWIEVTEGNTVDYTVLENKIIELGKLYKIIEIDADMKFAMMLLQRLEKVGFTCVDIPQTFMNMTTPLNSAEKLIRDGKITHLDDQVAKWTFGNASIAQNGNGNMKLVKEHKGRSVVRSKRIDPIVAWMNAMSRAVTYKGSVDLSAQILSDDWGM